MLRNKLILLLGVILVIPSFYAQTLSENDYNKIVHLIGGPKLFLDDSKIGPELKNELKQYAENTGNFPKKFNHY